MVERRCSSRGGTRTTPGVVIGRAGQCRPVRPSSSEILHQPFRIATWNVGSLKGRSSEVVETLTRRGIDICCLQETRWRGGSARSITGKNSKYKLYWIGNQAGTGGVGILLAERWTDKVYDIARISDRTIILKLCIDKVIITVVCVYAPQVGLDTHCKDEFYDNLNSAMAKISNQETVLVCGDFNGHIGSEANGFEGVHGGYGYGKRNPEGDRILEFATAHNLVVGNSYFTKHPQNLVTYRSGGHSSQIDYVLLRRNDLKAAKNIKVIASEECVAQHHLLICDLRLMIAPQQRRPYISKIRFWKLRDQDTSNTYRQCMNDVLQTSEMPSSVEDTWTLLRSSLLDTAEKVCGRTNKRPPRRETWWWNQDVSAAVSRKRRLWKLWMKGGSKEQYLEAKREAKRAVYIARRSAEERDLRNLHEGKDNIFRVAKQMRRDNQDVSGEKCVRDDQGVMSLDDEAKKAAWRQHYERLLNIEFAWNRDSLSAAEPILGPPPFISEKLVQTAINKMKVGKAAGPSGIVAELLKASGAECCRVVTQLTNAIIREDCIPSDWNTSFIVNLYKGKGDALERGNYRGLKLLDQVMKVIERVMESYIRSIVSIDEMQFGFMPGRGTTDAVFILRQLQEKYLAKNRPLYFGFIDLEKAFDRVPREVLWWAMRKVGVEEWMVKVVQRMYHSASSKVRVGSTYSEAFNVQVGVHQGSVLSPLLFIIVLEALSREFRTGCPWEMLYADDLVIVSESIEDLSARISSWKKHLENKGLRVNMKKTKILCSGRNLDVLQDAGKWPCGVCRRGVGGNSILCSGCDCWVHKTCSGIKGSLVPDPSYLCRRCRGLARPIDGRPLQHLTVEGQELEAVDSFCYLGDTVSATGGYMASITIRCRAAWSKFRELLPLLTNRAISLNTRGRIYSSCVRSVMLYASECWALRNDELARLIRNDRAMLRWICGIKPDEEVHTHTLCDRLNIPYLDVTLRYNRLRWAGHVHRSQSWTGRCQSLQIDGRRGTGRPRKTWNDTINEDLQTYNLSLDMAEDRDAWRSTLRNATRRVQPPY